MIINGIDVPNVFPITSETYGNGYEIRVAKYVDGIKKTMQETFYNKSNLKDFALITEIAKIKQNLINKIATGEAKSNIIKPKKFSEIGAKYLASKSGKSNGYYLGRCRIVRELNEVFGNKYFSQIKQADLEQYVMAQNSRTYGEHIARAKDELAKEKTHNAELSYGIRKLNADKGISLKVLQNAHKGKNIAYTSAQRLCSALGLTFSDVFIDETIENYYSDETLESVVETIYAIFERARLDKQIAVNPIKDYELYGLVDGLPAKGREILTEQEHKQFLAQLDKISTIDAIPFELMVGTGMRSCEVGGLSWDDILFEKDSVNIKFNRQCKEKKKRREKLKSKTKTVNAVRPIPLTPRLKRKLLEYKECWEEMKEDNDEFSASNAVYCDINGNPKDTSELNEALERILFDMDCPSVRGKNITCHCLRHYWITELINKGMTPPEVQELAGHADMSTTMGYYHKQSQEKTAQKFQEAFKEYV